MKIRMFLTIASREDRICNQARGLDWVFFDGECAFCHRSMKRLAEYDPDGRKFRFAPSGGETWTRLLGIAGRIGSIAILTDDGRMLTRSDAVLHAMCRLGPWWNRLARAGKIVPKFIRDGVYKLIAKNRHRFSNSAAGPAVTCPIPDGRRFFR